MLSASRDRLGSAVDRGRSAVELAVRPHQGLLNLHRRFGPVSAFRFGRQRYVFLLGPDANQFVLSHSRLFRWREAFEVLRVVDGDTALIVSDGEDHQRRRRLVTPAFGRRQIETYTETMRATADAAIDRWRPGQRIDLYGELRSVIRRGTIRVLFGPRLATDESELGQLLEQALAVVDRPPPVQQLQRFGLPSWRRARAARAAVARRVHEEIEHRRRGRAGAQEGDVLGLLVDSRDGDGPGLTDVEITDQVISLIAAGFETTSAAMGWATHALLADSTVWRNAQASLDVPGDWRYVDGVVSETLRLYPPAVVSARMAAEAFDFAGHRVPTGSLVLYSPYVTHRLPELWPDPSRFDPQRWNPGQPGYRRPGPHEFLPFGGGPHRCLGAAFAATQMTVLLEQLLRRTSLHLEHVDTTPVGLTAMRPRHGPIARVAARERPTPHQDHETSR